MTAVADLERLLERVFERTTSRLFGSGVQVVQIERRVERVMERARTREGTHVAVPARYRVRLHPTDLSDLSKRAGDATQVASRLADGALAFARSHGYHLAGRPEVWLVADPIVDRGVVMVEVAPGVKRSAPPGAARPVSPAAAGPAVLGTEADRGSGPVGVPVDPAPGPVSTPPAPTTGIRDDGAGTIAFRRPAPLPARAILRICDRDGRERTVEVDGTPLTIGRARDNLLAIDDGRVSRHHGRLQARRGTLVYTDLDSTNGSRVNGIRVDEIVLGQGDRLQVGDTVLVVETLPG